MPHDPAVQLANINGGEAVSVGEGRSLDDRSKSPPPSPSAQQQAAQLAALLNFRPSSRDVISGIAPHIFDDQPSAYRRSRSRRRRRTSSSERRRRSVSPAPHRSPLRLSVVISVDEHGAFQPPKGEESVVLEVYTTPSRTSAPLPPIATPTLPASSENQNNVKKPKPRGSFRIDRVLKTFVLRLK